MKLTNVVGVKAESYFSLQWLVCPLKTKCLRSTLEGTLPPHKHCYSRWVALQFHVCFKFTDVVFPQFNLTLRYLLDVRLRNRVASLKVLQR